jgi:hypothetical protein
MNIIIVIIVLAALGLLGAVTKSIIAVLIGAAGLAVSFLMFCTGTLLNILGHVIAFVISLVLLVAAIVFIPALLIVIIPGIILAYWYVKKKGNFRPVAEILKRKAIDGRTSV